MLTSNIPNKPKVPGRGLVPGVAAGGCASNARRQCLGCQYWKSMVECASSDTSLRNQLKRLLANQLCCEYTFGCTKIVTRSTPVIL